MNNLLSYCGLVDAKIRASDKELPVRLIILYLKIGSFKKKKCRKKIRSKKPNSIKLIILHIRHFESF